jgi:hypothetical protein
VPKDPVTSGNAEAGVFAYVQAYAAQSGRMSGVVDEAWTGSWGIAADEAPWSRVEPLIVVWVLERMRARISAWGRLTTRYPWARFCRRPP